MNRVEKPWGYEEWVEVNERYVVKRLFMERGNACSLQYHNHKRETIVVLEGTLNLEVEGDISVLGPFDTVTIRPGEVHRMAAKTDDCLYLESSTPELDDVVRVQDHYGRT